ncbi:hypothetical protein ACIPYS_07300 [Kitasatospora sp. NPDC089913]|uniref:hypothetical protein n=1 Tax=Kitasatospora sp. NPDC089913 TaxID=3364080 RepID=UPI0037FCE0DF
MSELPSFTVLLQRLLDHRGPESAPAAARADGPASAAVLAGATPDGPLLRDLAPALGLDPADLFEIADVPLPPDLAPGGGMVTTSVVGVLRLCRALPAERRGELLDFVAALPPSPPSSQGARIEGLPARLPRSAQPGNLLMRLVAVRNLGWTGTAKVFRLLTGRSWMADAYGRIATGEQPVTPDLLVDFATVLAWPAPELAALLGVPLSGQPPVPPAEVADTARLLVGLRRLGVAQLREAEDLARALG